jgi:hypothetical protein
VGALFSSEVSFTQEMLLWEDGLPRPVGDAEPDADDIATVAEPA